MLCRECLCRQGRLHSSQLQWHLDPGSVRRWRKLTGHCNRDNRRGSSRANDNWCGSEVLTLIHKLDTRRDIELFSHQGEHLENIISYQCHSLVLKENDSRSFRWQAAGSRIHGELLLSVSHKCPWVPAPAHT